MKNTKPKLTLIRNEELITKAESFMPIKEPKLPVIIGVGGRKRAGKDSVCNILVKEYGYEKLAFANALREMCSRVFYLPIENFLDDDLKEKPLDRKIEFSSLHINSILGIIQTDHYYQRKFVEYHQLYDHAVKQGVEDLIGIEFTTPRHILQIIGTEFIRNCVYPEFHCNVLAYYTQSKLLSMASKKEGPPIRFCIADCRFPNERKLVKDLRGTTILITSPTDKTDCIHASEVSVGNRRSYDHQFYNEKQGLDKLDKDFVKFLSKKFPGI